MPHATGPKISSRAMRSALSTSSKIVGSTKEPRSSAAPNALQEEAARLRDTQNGRTKTPRRY